MDEDVNSGVKFRIAMNPASVESGGAWVKQEVRAAGDRAEKTRGHEPR